MAKINALNTAAPAALVGAAPVTLDAPAPDMGAPAPVDPLLVAHSAIKGGNKVARAELVDDTKRAAQFAAWRNGKTVPVDGMRALRLGETPRPDDVVTVRAGAQAAGVAQAAILDWLRGMGCTDAQGVPVATFVTACAAGTGRDKGYVTSAKASMCTHGKGCNAGAHKLIVFSARA